MSFLIVLCPLLSSIVAGLFGRYTGVTGSQITAVFLMMMSLVSLVISIVDYLMSGTTTVSLVSFVNQDYLSSDWGMLLDGLSLGLMFAVVLISFCVHLFSVNYMGNDPHHQRFLGYLSFFTASMLVLVSSPSVLQLFVGWELIGVSSYLLIGFWFSRLPASQSALQAFVINRLGDVALSIGLYITFFVFSTLNFSSLLCLSSEVNTYPLLTLSLLIASMAKSAQFGLQTWLPQAMEGPTPVSALIHAATLVTAGAYLLLRVSPLLSNSDWSLIITGLVGSLTAVFAGTIGVLQNDLKRIIAFSTCSQIGYLFISIGAGQYHVALFHMVNHAMFKALLFLSSGVVIHGVGDNQDVRRMGGLVNYLPLAYISLLVGSLSLMALPFLTGFYSKELIIELGFVQFTVLPEVLYFLATIAASLTGYYSMRLLTLTFFSNANCRPSDYLNIHSPNWIMITPLVILFVLSVLMGYLFKDLFSGLGSPFLANNSFLTEVEFWMSPSLKFLPLFLTLFASLLGFVYPVFQGNQSSTLLNRSAIKFLSIKWGLDVIVNRLGFFVLSLGLNCSKVIDRGLVEMVGPYGLTLSLAQLSVNVTQSYYLSRYCLAIALTLVLSLSIFVTPEAWGWSRTISSKLRRSPQDLIETVQSQQAYDWSDLNTHDKCHSILNAAWLPFQHSRLEGMD